LRAPAITLPDRRAVSNCPMLDADVGKGEGIIHMQTKVDKGLGNRYVLQTSFIDDPLGLAL